MNTLADMIDELPFWSAPFGLKLLDFIHYKPNISAIDIGCGAGFPLTEIAMRLGETAVVYGIDPWSELTERARRKMEYYGLNNVKIIEGMAESIPLPDHSIDLITSNNGINNVADINKVLEECSRVIRDGGQFIQTMNTDRTMFEFYDTLKDVLFKRRLFAEIESVNRHIALKRPAIERITAKMQETGFIVKDLEYDQFNFRFTNGTAMFNHFLIRFAFMDSWTSLLPEDRAGEIFDSVEQALNKQAELLGVLTLSIPYVLINAIKRE
ncbi:MAG: methyltransferase domain-containing protein [Tannerellaceae bacterium]|jgi:ubiquinone/menaquinone biosynthesis C-methylase UbiE|nr:methyltransferase domain-containing protein [Tannerellaceae bacterium]